MGRITASQKANLNDLDRYKTKIKDLKNKNVVLDIGFGNGEYTAAYANAFQEKHLIATEVYLSGIGSLIGLINKYKIFIYPRKGTLKENLHIINENTMYIGGPRIDLSSTNIRKIISKKSDPKDLISTKVMEYINSNKLYQ